VQCAGNLYAIIATEFNGHVRTAIIKGRIGHLLEITALAKGFAILAIARRDAIALFAGGKCKQLLEGLASSEAGPWKGR